MEYSADQLKELIRQTDSLIEQSAENEDRVHIVLLKKLGLIRKPKTHEEYMHNVLIVRQLFEAGWEDTTIISALKNFHLDKKCIIELMLLALNACEYDERKILTDTQISESEKIAIITRIAKALDDALWDDDEIAALLLKFVSGQLAVHALENIGWHDKKIVKALSDTRKSEFIILLILAKAGWSRLRIIKSIAAIKWSDYNIVNQLTNNIRWPDTQLIQALLALKWDENRICYVLFSFWTGERILKAFIGTDSKVKRLAAVVNIMFKKGRLSEAEIIQIFEDQQLESKKIEQILEKAKQGLMSWDEIQNRLLG